VQVQMQVQVQQGCVHACGLLTAR